MRRLFVGAVLSLLLLAGPSFAWADTVAFYADVPVVYTFSDSNLADASPSGIMLGVQLPLLFNLGVESYKVSGNVSTTPFNYNVTMADLFFDIPFPAANLVLGAGAGQGKFETTGTSYGNALLTQLYFSLGIPFAGVFDAHVGYHRVFGEADITGTSSKVNLDAGMATVGIKMGF